MHLKVNEKLITLNTKAKTWQEGIKVSGQTLLDQGFIESRYIDACIENVNKMGPYIVIAPNVAMPHSRAEDGVIKTGIAITTFKSPVNFKKENDDKYSCRLFIFVAAKDNETHINTLQQIANTLSKENVLDQVLNATKTKEIVKIFK